MKLRVRDVYHGDRATQSRLLAVSSFGSRSSVADRFVATCGGPSSAMSGRSPARRSWLQSSHLRKEKARHLGGLVVRRWPVTACACAKLPNRRGLGREGGGSRARDCSVEGVQRDDAIPRGTWDRQVQAGKLPAPRTRGLLVQVALREHLPRDSNDRVLISQELPAYRRRT